MVELGFAPKQWERLGLHTWMMVQIAYKRGLGKSELRVHMRSVGFHEANVVPPTGKCVQT